MLQNIQDRWQWSFTGKKSMNQVYCMQVETKKTQRTFTNDRGTVSISKNRKNSIFRGR